jgi:soluble lytic murein transglycosylase-like protein
MKPWWRSTDTNRRQVERRNSDRRAQPRVGRDRRRRDRRARALLVSLAALASVPTATRRGFEDIDQRPGSPLLGDLPPETPLPDESTPEGRELYESIIQEAAALHGVDEDLVRAVIQTESGFDPQAVSRVGAKGLMQMMPATAKRMGVEDPFDPRENIMGGVKYLRMLLDKFKGNVPLALAGYNAGPRKVTRFKGIPPYKETRGYVKKVLREMAEEESETTVVAANAAPSPEPKKPTVIYKWTDKKGHLYLSDTPPTGSVPYVVLKTGD